MIDVKFLRNYPEKVKEGCRKKNVEIDVDELLGLDKKRRELILAYEEMLSKKNKASEIIGKTKDKTERESLILEMRELDQNNDRLSEDVKKVEIDFNSALRKIPNLPLDSVPVGKDERENVVLREVGKKKDFGFSPKEYMEIAQNFDLIDTERAAKVSGSRFGYFKREVALMEFALVNLVFETLTKEGFIPVVPPVMIKPEMMAAMGYTERGGDEIYFLKDDDLCLVGTSEQSIGAMHQGEIFNDDELPKRYVSFSTCFRREAGSYGKDTKGVLRVHQFDKIEMFSFCHPEKAEEEHEFLLSMEEKLMNALELPYRVLSICSGDLGDSAAAKYDIEAWMPGQNQYRETHSTSNCTDFQARRLNVKYRDSQSKKTEFLHTLNGTAFAIGRIIISILENYQKENGEVEVPKVLQKYLNFKKIGK